MYPITSGNLKELNAMLSFSQQPPSVQQSPNGLNISNYNMISSNNKIIKGSENQIPPVSITDINNNAQNYKTTHSKYDPNKKPPLVQIAQEHQQSLMVGINKKHVAKPELLKSCSCCQRQIEKTQFSLNCELNKMYFLGSGPTLYFYFLKLCIGLTFIHLSSSSVYCLVSNLKGDKCITKIEDSTEADTTSYYNNCYQNWITITTLGNILNSSSNIEIQSILGTITVFLMILAVHYYRGVARKVVNDMEYDVKHSSIADYSIMITGIDPKLITTNFAESIKFYFENNITVHLLDRMLKVESVDLCFDVTTTKRLKSQKMIIEKQIQVIRSRRIIPDKIQKNLDELEKQVSQINKEIQEFEIHAAQRDLKFYQKYFLGKAFVSFSTIKEKDLLLQQFQIPPDYRLWGLRSQVEFQPGSAKIEISQAPHPREVNWDNLFLNSDQYFKKNTAGLIYCFLISILAINLIQQNKISAFILIYFNQTDFLINRFFFLIIMAFLLVQYFFLEQNVSNLEDNETDITLAMSLSVAFLIPILNKLLVIIIRRISINEQHPTTNIQLYQATRNLAKSQIFITCFTTFFIQLIFSNNDYVGRLFNSGGLVHNQMLILLTQSFLLSIISLLDIDGKSSHWNRREIELCSSHTQINLTQRQLNQLYEPPEMDFMDGYSSVLTILCQSLFYSILIPVGVVFAFCGLFVKYWVDKYIFIRKRSCIHKQNHFLSFLMTDIIEYIIIIYALGNLIFLLYSQQYFIPYASIVGVILAVVNCIIPSDLINQKIFLSVRKEQTEIPFIVAKEKFPETYNQINPASQLFSTQKKISNNQKGKDEQNKSGSRQKIQLDEYQNEIHSLTILNSPEQQKGGLSHELANSKVLQASQYKNSMNYRTPSKPNIEDNYLNSSNKNIKSSSNIQSHHMYSGSNKENINRPAINSQRSQYGGDGGKPGQVLNMSSSFINDLVSNNQSAYHMKQKDFQQIQQKIKNHDESYMEEPDMFNSPIKQRVK